MAIFFCLGKGELSLKIVFLGNCNCANGMLYILSLIDKLFFYKILPLRINGEV